MAIVFLTNRAAAKTKIKTRLAAQKVDVVLHERKIQIVHENVLHRVYNRYRMHSFELI